ncbi:MAG TPA: chloramphenicol acetyltransferase [Bacteroidetes bacterium]|nr:chloramphenicol acetyltransferase [Bacteroidota bacterium]
MKQIHFTNEHRRRHFEFFKNMNHPHFSITANVDITRLRAYIRQKQLPFMPMIAWWVSKTANELPPFRQRIRNGQVVEHDVVHPSFAVDTEAADVFSFCEVKYTANHNAFIAEAKKKMDIIKKQPSFEDEPGRDDYLFLSSIPWVSFTGITHAMYYHPCDSVPRITWGKFFPKGHKIKMPLSVQVHHALVDGRHVGQFFQRFEQAAI